MTSQENKPITTDPPKPPGTPDPPDLDIDVKKLQRKAESDESQSDEPDGGGTKTEPSD
jgi:hypothetical protein